MGDPSAVTSQHRSVHAPSLLDARNAERGMMDTSQRNRAPSASPTPRTAPGTVDKQQTLGDELANEAGRGLRRPRPGPRAPA